MQTATFTRQTVSTSFGCSRRCLPVSRSSSRTASRQVTRATANTPKPTDRLQREVERFLQKYDVVSAGVGALTVTSYCVWRGQDPWTALSITFAATVAALVINECVFDASEDSQ